MPHKYGRPRYNRRRMGKPRRDKGKRHKHSEAYKAKMAELNKPIEVEVNEKDIYIPKKTSVLKQYVMMFHWYCRAYEYYKDRDLAIYSVQNKFHITEKTIQRAIRACKYLQQEKIKRETMLNTNSQ